MSWVLVNFYQFRIKIKNRYVMFGGTIPSFPVLVLVSDQAEQMGTDGICPNPVFAENNPNYFLKVWNTFLEKQLADETIVCTFKLGQNWISFPKFETVPPDLGVRK